MKTMVSILGTVLIILGVIGFYYKYFIYNKNENVAQIGNVSITAQREEVYVISPAISAITLGAGVLLLIIGMRK